MPFSNSYYLALIVIFVIIVVVKMLIAHRKRQSRLDAWSGLAGRLGLTCDSGRHFWSPIRVSGTYRGHALLLDSFTRSQGKKSESFTRIVMRLKKTASVHLLLYEEKITGKVGKWFGAQDIQTGIESIDRRYMIKGNPEDSIIKLMAPLEVQEKLLSVPYLHLEVNGNIIYFEKPGLVSDTNYLENLFIVLDAMAKIIDEISPDPSSTSHVPDFISLAQQNNRIDFKQILTAKQVKEAFARQKINRYLYGAFLVVFIIILGLWMQPSSFAPPNRWVDIAIGGLSVIYLVFAVLLPRCPLCKSIVRSGRDVRTCPKCGAELV